MEDDGETFVGGSGGNGETELEKIKRAAECVLSIMSVLDGLLIPELMNIAARKTGLDRRLVGRAMGMLLDQGKIRLNDEMDPYLP